MRISDWSSDVCSSDLLALLGGEDRRLRHGAHPTASPGSGKLRPSEPHGVIDPAIAAAAAAGSSAPVTDRPRTSRPAPRCEERRLGQEVGSMCSFSWYPSHQKKNINRPPHTTNN